MPKFEAYFYGSIISDDVNVSLCGTAKVEAANEDAAIEAGFKKIMELNVFFEDQQVEWEHVRTLEFCGCGKGEDHNLPCHFECPTCLRKTKDPESFVCAECRKN